MRDVLIRVCATIIGLATVANVGMAANSAIAGQPLS